MTDEKTLRHERFVAIINRWLDAETNVLTKEIVVPLIMDSEPREATPVPRILLCGESCAPTRLH